MVTTTRLVGGVVEETVKSIPYPGSRYIGGPSYASYSPVEGGWKLGREERWARETVSGSTVKSRISATTKHGKGGESKVRDFPRIPIIPLLSLRPLFKGVPCLANSQKPYVIAVRSWALLIESDRENLRTRPVSNGLLVQCLMTSMEIVIRVMTKIAR